MELIRLDRSVLKNTTLQKNRPGVAVMNKNGNTCGRKNGTVEVVNAGVAIIHETPTVKTLNATVLA